MTDSVRIVTESSLQVRPEFTKAPARGAFLLRVDPQ